MCVPTYLYVHPGSFCNEFETTAPIHIYGDCAAGCSQKWIYQTTTNYWSFTAKAYVFFCIYVHYLLLFLTLQDPQQVNQD